MSLRRVFLRRISFAVAHSDSYASRISGLSRDSANARTKGLAISSVAFIRKLFDACTAIATATSVPIIAATQDPSSTQFVQCDMLSIARQLQESTSEHSRRFRRHNGSIPPATGSVDLLAG
ncbi:hypothetical protein BAY61_20530 [Prauserella marina]|nr:hypothetical protein BAY61_20530 [Prauserella marina]